MACSRVVPHTLRKRGESKAIGLDGLVVTIIGVLIAIIGALQRKGRKEICVIIHFNHSVRCLQVLQNQGTEKMGNQLTDLPPLDPSPAEPAITMSVAATSKATAGAATDRTMPMLPHPLTVNSDILYQYHTASVPLHSLESSKLV